MCDGLVQHVSSKDSLAYFAHRDTPGNRFATLVTPLELCVTTPPKPQERHALIKPGMQVSAIRRRGGHLECIKVRWGWSPIWSVGTMPPLTHLPLHLVMRSKVFDPIKHEGRVLVAVEGWYEPQPPPHPLRRNSSPTRPTGNRPRSSWPPWPRPARPRLAVTAWPW